MCIYIYAKLLLNCAWPSRVLRLQNFLKIWSSGVRVDGADPWPKILGKFRGLGAASQGILLLNGFGSGPRP